MHPVHFCHMTHNYLPNKLCILPKPVHMYQGSWHLYSVHFTCDASLLFIIIKTDMVTRLHYKLDYLVPLTCIISNQ